MCFVLHPHQAVLSSGVCQCEKNRAMEDAMEVEAPQAQDGAEILQRLLMERVPAEIVVRLAGPRFLLKPSHVLLDC